MRRVIENGQHYVIRQGKRIAVTTLNETPKPQKARKAFKVEWVKFPTAWREALHRAKSAGTTYDLALAILFEAFKREHAGGEIVLSAGLTEMSRYARRRATKELVKLGLIKLHRQSGSQAYRVSPISITKNKKNRIGPWGVQNIPLRGSKTYP